MADAAMGGKEKMRRMVFFVREAWRPPEGRVFFFLKKKEAKKTLFVWTGDVFGVDGFLRFARNGDSANE
jgi:hypothetical protein